jgi:hypothetical protein
MHRAGHATNGRWFDLMAAGLILLAAAGLGYAGYRALTFFIWGN